LAERNYFHLGKLVNREPFIGRPSLGQESKGTLGIIPWGPPKVFRNPQDFLGPTPENFKRGYIHGVFKPRGPHLRKAKGEPFMGTFTGKAFGFPQRGPFFGKGLAWVGGTSLSFFFPFGAFGGI